MILSISQGLQIILKLLPFQNSSRTHYLAQALDHYAQVLFLS